MNDTTTESPPPPKPAFRLPMRWPWQGLAGVILWMILFAVGVLVDSSPYRERLGWKSPNEQPAKVSEVEQRIWLLENPGKELPTAEENSAASAAAKDDPEAPPGAFESFLIAMFAFMPLNIGFLCILASYIGGCSVNKDEVARVEDLIAALASDDHSPEAERLRRRLSYLTENPLNSTMRGLVVYLILISGLFVLGSSPVGMGDNQLIDLTQYMRLAGMFSFFGYIAGNDPTVFFTLLNLGSARLRPAQQDGGK